MHSRPSPLTPATYAPLCQDLDQDGFPAHQISAGVIIHTRMMQTVILLELTFVSQPT